MARFAAVGHSRCELAFVYISMTCRAGQGARPPKLPRAERVHFPRQVALHAWCGNMRAGEGKFCFCMIDRGKLYNRKTVFGVAGLTPAVIRPRCKLSSMRIRVTIFTLPKFGDMKSELAADIFYRRNRRMTLITFQVCVFSLQRKLRYRMIEHAAFHLQEARGRVTSIALLRKFSLVRIGMTRAA
jgi:hypothetical protein